MSVSIKIVESWKEKRVPTKVSQNSIRICANGLVQMNVEEKAPHTKHVNR